MTRPCTPTSGVPGPTRRSAHHRQYRAAAKRAGRGTRGIKRPLFGRLAPDLFPALITGDPGRVLAVVLRPIIGPKTTAQVGLGTTGSRAQTIGCFASCPDSQAQAVGGHTGVCGRLCPSSATSGRRGHPASVGRRDPGLSRPNLGGGPGGWGGGMAILVGNTGSPRVGEGALSWGPCIGPVITPGTHGVGRCAELGFARGPSRPEGGGPGCVRRRSPMGQRGPSAVQTPSPVTTGLPVGMDP